MQGFRFHDLRHTAATLAAASGTSLKALMARIGHASAAAALRYQHVIDGQDADIVRYLERFGEEPSVPSRAHDNTPESARVRVKSRYPHDTLAPVGRRQSPSLVGTQVGTTPDPAGSTEEPQAHDQQLCGGDDGTRTHDPLLAKQVL